MKKFIFQNLIQSHLRASFYLLSLLVILACSCSGAGTGGLGLDSFIEGSGATNDSGAGSAGDDGSTSGDPDDSGVDLPVGSIPPPALKGLSGEVTLAYLPDSEGVVPTIGQAGAAEVGNGNIVVVSSDPISNDLALMTPDRQSPLERFLMPEAQALNVDLNVNQMMCAEDNVSCCPIDESGAFTCFFELEDQSVNELHLAVVDPDGNISENLVEPINENLLYLGQTPSDIKPGFALAGGKGVRIALTQNAEAMFTEHPRVFGNHGENYERVDAESVQEFGVDELNQVLVMREPERGVTVKFYQENEQNDVQFLDDVVDLFVPNTLEYTKLKTANGRLSFARMPLNEEDGGKIYKIPENIRPDFVQRGQLPSIDFLPRIRGNFHENDSPTHRETITFDVDRNEFVLVVFKDLEGQTKLRMGNEAHRDANFWVGEVGDTLDLPEGAYKEISIYQQNLDADTEGHALLLDGLNNRIVIVKFNYNVLNSYLEISNWINLGPNKSPEEFIITNGKAYIPNKSDHTLTILPLFNGNQPLLAEQVQASKVDVNLQDYVRKPLSVGANSITFQNNKFLIGSEDLRAAIIVNIDTLPEPVIKTIISEDASVEESEAPEPELIDEAVPEVDIQVTPPEKVEETVTSEPSTNYDPEQYLSNECKYLFEIVSNPETSDSYRKIIQEIYREKECDKYYTPEKK